MTKPKWGSDVLAKVAVACLIAAATALILHEVRLSSLEARQFSPEEALSFERDTNARFKEIDQKLSTLQADVRVIRTLLERR